MHFLGGGWEEGKGEEQVEKKSGEGGGGEIISILEKVTNTRTAGSWVQIKRRKY